MDILVENISVKLKEWKAEEWTNICFYLKGLSPVKNARKYCIKIIIFCIFGSKSLQISNHIMNLTENGYCTSQTLFMLNDIQVVVVRSQDKGFLDLKIAVIA